MSFGIVTLLQIYICKLLFTLLYKSNDTEDAENWPYIISVWVAY